MFNVIEHPLERANLKERHKDVYDRIVAEWQAWNASMLPEIAESFTNSFTGEELADHYGAQKPSGRPILPCLLALQRSRGDRSIQSRSRNTMSLRKRWDHAAAQAVSVLRSPVLRVERLSAVVVSSATPPAADPVSNSKRFAP